MSTSDLRLWPDPDVPAGRTSPPPGRLAVATDGSALGNPGPGGWAWVDAHGATGAGREAHTTNNRMELRAVLEAVRAHSGRPLEIQSDSRYAINCVTVWLTVWQRRGWRTASGSPVENRDLIEAAVAELAAADAVFTWVRGHAGHGLNERANGLARAQAAAATP